MGVVDQHVGLDRVERLRDRGEMRLVRARDAPDELEIVRRLDRLGDGAAGPAGDAGDADADSGHMWRIGA